MSVQEHHAKLRRHQRDALALAKRLALGSLRQKALVAAVTPGGGKTLLASIVAQTLLASRAVDGVCIVCPRESLVQQVRHGFTVPELGLPLGITASSNHGLERLALFPHERAGYVTTYQAVSAAPERHQALFSKGRWLLVLDESHHVAEGQHRAWKNAVEPLVERAAHVLLMTGTMLRDDRARLAFIEYDDKRRPKVDIRYTRRDALKERAILPISVKLCDGVARYWHAYGRKDVVVSEAGDQEASRALQTLLRDSGYRNSVLRSAMSEWERYRDLYYRSRMIVITHSQSSARSVSDYVRRHSRWEPVLAISSDGDAHRKLQRFRERGEGDILVTCMMAYEGLDVPDCTHLVCLSDVRSMSWLEQAFARVTRVNTACRLPWERQQAFLYVPNDPSMVRYLDDALGEQDERFEEDAGAAAAGVDANRRCSTFVPIQGELTSFRYGDSDGVFREVDNRRITRFDDAYPAFVGHPAADRLTLARALWPEFGDPKLPAVERA